MVGYKWLDFDVIFCNRVAIVKQNQPKLERKVNNQNLIFLWVDLILPVVTPWIGIFFSMESYRKTPEAEGLPVGECRRNYLEIPFRLRSGARKWPVLLPRSYDLRYLFSFPIFLSGLD